MQYTPFLFPYLGGVPFPDQVASAVWDTSVPYSRITYNGHANTGVWPARVSTLIVGGNAPCWRSATDGVTADSPLAVLGAPNFDSAAVPSNLLKTPEDTSPPTGNVATLIGLFGGLNNPATVDGMIFYAIDITSIQSAGTGNPYDGDCIFMEHNNRGQLTLLKTPNRVRYCWFDDSAGVFKTTTANLPSGTGRLNVMVQRKGGDVSLSIDGTTFTAPVATGSVNGSAVVRAGINVNDAAGKLNAMILCNAWYNNFAPSNAAAAKKWFDWANATYP